MSHSTTNNSPKYCQCGCGELAPIAKTSDATRGYVRGQPMRFIAGHQNKGRIRKSVEDRFWEKVIKRGPDDCWEWIGCRAKTGHGQMYLEGKKVAPHRISWELHNGPIPDGLHCLHHCDNGWCMNPAHLWLGTHADNMADRDKKGRGTKPPVHHDKGEKAPNAHYTDAEIREIRRQYSMGYMSIRKFARLHNMHHVTMWKILKGISYPGV